MIDASIQAASGWIFVSGDRIKVAASRVAARGMMLQSRDATRPCALWGRPSFFPFVLFYLSAILAFKKGLVFNIFFEFQNLLKFGKKIGKYKNSWILKCAYYFEKCSELQKLFKKFKTMFVNSKKVQNFYKMLVHSENRL